MGRFVLGRNMSSVERSGETLAHKSGPLTITGAVMLSLLLNRVWADSIFGKGSVLPRNPDEEPADDQDRQTR